MLEKTAKTEAFWQAFLASGETAGAGDYCVVAFGDRSAMASELAALVVTGVKRATASLLHNYGDGGEPLPQVGDYVVVVDGNGDCQCIWRTTEIEIKPLIDVDDRFAWDEGEGDRSRDWWLTAHRKFFARRAARDGFVMHDGVETVFERFEIVWPPALADRNREPSSTPPMSVASCASRCWHRTSSRSSWTACSRWR